MIYCRTVQICDIHQKINFEIYHVHKFTVRDRMMATNQVDSEEKVWGKYVSGSHSERSPL